MMGYSFQFERQPGTFLHLLRREMLEGEISSQLQKFITAFGRLPDFVDGHQHVHLFPQIREALLSVVKNVASNVWVRQCGRIGPLHKRVAVGKAIALDILSNGFRRLANRYGVRVNPAFAGTYGFAKDADYAQIFPKFLRGLPDGSVVMCHPDFVDAELQRLDPLTTLRERFPACSTPMASRCCLCRRLTLIYDRFSNRPRGSSTFRLSTTPMSMSLVGSGFSSDSAPRPLYGAF